ncbi:MAG: HYR domain-containing protein, partial [Bacteroidota bacterium]|nr:HYR domain-containing protein [Bacteroidota bacterium]
IEFPEDLEIPCDADVMNLTLTGNLSMPNNACAYLIDTTYSEEIGEVQPYLYARKWIAIDYCGHKEEKTQMITLVDNVKPEIIVQDKHITFAQGSEITINVNDVVLQVNDNCDSDVELSLSQELFTCEDFMTSSEVLLTITATDDQGNVTVEEVTVILDGGLFLIDCPQNIVVNLEPGECSAGVTYVMNPQGLCGQDPVMTQIDGTGLTSGDDFPIGTTHLLYSITDQLGYTLECGFDVEVLEFVGGIPLACQDEIHVSVVFECEAVINADMLLEGDHYGCYDDYIITFTNPNVVFENGVLFAEPWINQYLEACITDPSNGNYCCSQLLIEDKLPPTLTCSDITLDCTDDIAPQAIPHFPVPPEAVVTPLGGNKFQVIGIDNCGATVISYTDTEQAFMCDGIYSRIITRTWVAVDESGHSVTCTEQLFLLRGLIDDFVLPNDTTIYCGNLCIRPDGTPDPDCIGGIEGPFCGTFFIGYIDKVVGYCGSSYAVKRDWSLVDWCTGQIIDHEQIINVADTVPPVVECVEVIQVPADFNECGAAITLTPPPSYDECGSEPLTYELIYNSQIIQPVNGQYTLPHLIIGLYHITWKVRDACGNLTICETSIELFDNTPPTAYCDKHTVIAINNQDPMGVALLPATTLDDVSFDNCGPVTFRARRMSSCISFDWTGSGHSHIPDGDVDAFDQGTLYNEYVPFSCCDVTENYILVQLEVTDQHGNVNYCMVEVEVQDKLSPLITCPPDITVSCDFWFDPNVLEHPDNRTFGTVVDGFTYDESARQPIYINDPGNPNFQQPHYWGIDGYVYDNCNLEMDIRVTVIDDCSGDDLPAGAPEGAVKLIQRRFTATDPSGRIGFCTQRIWVVNFNPFYINELNPQDPNDDVVWPADIELDHCGLPDTIYPIILNEACAHIGINLKERRFEHTEGACVKILRDWTIIDWCQYDTQTGSGIWRYTQIVKIKDNAGVLFTNCEPGIQVLCDSSEEVTPIVNPSFETSCFVHVKLWKHIEDICSAEITYDVKIYPPGSNNYILAVPPTDVAMGSNGTFDLHLNTATSSNISLRNFGLEYNDKNNPNQYYRVLWSVIDGCGNVTTCEDKIRLEDCKQPTPVCINGLSTVPMPSNGTVTIWAKDFDASSFDNCTPDQELRFSFSGTVYQPSRIFTCDDILVLGVELPINIWVWDNWGNKDYCSTNIVFTDPSGVCGLPMGGVSGVVSTPEDHENVANVGIHLIKSGEVFGSITTTNDGSFHFPVVPAGQMYTLEAGRNDNPKNGVTTLD